MTITITAAHSAARLQGTKDYVETGTGTAKIGIYSTARGLVTDAAPTAICEIPLANPSGTIDGTGYHLDPSADGLNATTAVAVWARLFNRNGDVVADFDVRAQSDDPSLGEIALPSTTLYAGGLTRLYSSTLT